MELIALQGHLQSGHKFKGQTNALAKHLKKLKITLIFIDAPYLCEESTPDTPLYTWVKDGHIEESFNVIAKAHEEHPNAVGLFGFSMGAMLAIKLFSMKQLGEDPRFDWIKIMVCCAAPFPNEGSPLAPTREFVGEIPVLFVIGKEDQIAVPDSQRRYLKFFPNATVYEHDGGHYIPSAKALVQPFLDFFQANL